MNAKVCPTCGRKREQNPGDYYHEKACEARSLRVQIAQTEDPVQRAKLKRRLEMAEYVGD